MKTILAGHSRQVSGSLSGSFDGLFVVPTYTLGTTILGALDRAETSEARASALVNFVRLVATTNAKPGRAEATLAALQIRARELLAIVACVVAN